MGVGTARLNSGARLQAIAIFAVVLAIDYASPVCVQSDSIWSIPTAISLLRQGNLDLDEYRPAAERQPHGTVPVGPHLYPWYPVAVSLVADPVVALLEGVARLALEVLPHPPRVFRNWDAHFRAEGDIPLDVFAQSSTSSRQSAPPSQWSCSGRPACASSRPPQLSSSRRSSPSAPGSGRRRAESSGSTARPSPCWQWWSGSSPSLRRGDGGRLRSGSRRAWPTSSVPPIASPRSGSWPIW